MKQKPSEKTQVIPGATGIERFQTLFFWLVCGVVFGLWVYEVVEI